MLTNGWKAPLKELNWNGSYISTLPVILCILADIKFIRIAVIHDNDVHLNDPYLDEILPAIYTKFGVPMALQSFQLDYEDKEFSHRERFSPEGDFFELRPGQEEKSTEVHRIIDGSVADVTRNRVGSHVGVIVITAKLAHLDKYLQGTARSPFRNPDGNYAIVVLQPLDESNEESVRIRDSVLGRLWRFYGILKVGLISCYRTTEFFYFNPFAKNDSNTAAPLSYSAWGRIFHANTGNFTKVHCGQLWSKLYSTFNSYPLIYRHFRHIPTSIQWTAYPKAFLRSRMFAEARNFSQAFGGYDGFVFGNLMQKLNFNSVVRNVTSLYTYGFIGPNRTFEGAYGDILYGRTAIATNPHVISDAVSSGLDYLYPISFEPLCIVTAKAPIVPRYLSFIQCYTPSTWVLIFSVQLVLYFLYVGIRRFFLKQLQPMQTSIFCEMFTVYTNDYSFNRILSQSVSQRIVFLIIAMFGLTINGIYEGSITTAYSTITFFKDIKTLKELDQSGCTILTESSYLQKNIFGFNSSDPLFNSLGRKVKLVHGAEGSLTERVIQEDNICVTSELSDFSLLEEYYVSENDNPLLNLVPECPRAFLESFIIRKGWPLAERFNTILKRFHSSGLLDFWYYTTESSILLRIHSLKLKNLTSTELIRPCDLDDLKFAFYIFGVGHLAALLAFALEKLHQKCLAKNR